MLVCCCPSFLFELSVRVLVKLAKLVFSIGNNVVPLRLLKLSFKRLSLVATGLVMYQKFILR